MADRAPHPTSMAVWEIPSAVVVNSGFTVRVGVKCSGGCQLTGQTIVVLNEAGIAVGEASLDEQPWPGTSALYTAEVELIAPVGKGQHCWSVTFVGAELDISHLDTFGSFSFRTVGHPEHRVTLTVLDKDTDVSIENVQVQLGVYRTSTDARGKANLEVPTGRYNLELWKVGYQAYSKVVEVAEIVTRKVKITCLPDPDPDSDDEQFWM